MRLSVITMLLLLATAIACDASISDIVVDYEEGCPNGVTSEQIDLYANEDFYVCGNAFLNGETLSAGTITANESLVMQTTADIIDGKFSLRGQANVHNHKVYYIPLALEQPCEKDFGQIPIEIKTSCVMVPPSTIEAVPNVITQGESFTLQVKNAPRNMEMRITGLTNEINTVINKGTSWTQTLESNECSETGSCIIQFEFTDSQHEICKTDTSVTVTVKTTKETTEETKEQNILLLATFLVLILGTAGAMILNRYL